MIKQDNKEISNITSIPDYMEENTNNKFLPGDLIIKINQDFDDYVFDELTNTIKRIINIDINEEKVKSWVTLCIELDNIDKSDLIDLATKKKFAEKDKEIEDLKNSLQLIRSLTLEMDDRYIRYPFKLDD